MTFGTPSKSRKSIVTSAVADEENQENVTVSARREWLKNFGQMHADRHRSPIKKNVSVTPKKTTAPLRKAVQDQQPVDSTASDPSEKVEKLVRNFTPQKKKKEHVGIKATDDGKASVAKLSEWLANDPTSKKKVSNIRRGKNISYKARNFEKSQLHEIAKASHIQKGSVTDKKNWLKNAFHLEEEEAPEDELTSRLNVQYAKSECGVPTTTRRPRSSICVSAKKDWLKTAFKTAERVSQEEDKVEEARSVIITNDAASSLSVSDKKSWLQNAFNKQTEGTTTPVKNAAGVRNYSKATSDIMHCRGNSRDEIAASAKKRFLERSTRRTPVKSPFRSTHSRVARPSFGGYRRQSITTLEGETEKKGSIVEPKHHILDEDTTSVDFRAARDLLVQRVSKNGKMEMEKERENVLKRPFDEMISELP